VVISLVDERWVDSTSPRSNAALVAKYLLQGEAQNSIFIPLYSGGDVPTDELVNLTNNRLNKNLPTPCDVVVLGMGADGHTASFFPGADNLQAALNDNGPALAIRAPGAGEPRITLTLSAILNTKSLYLHIEGQEKAKTLQKAIKGKQVEQMPVRAVLKQKQTMVQIFCSL